MWVVGRGFLNGMKRKWDIKGAPERRLGDHCPDMMKGRKKQHAYNPCHGGEQLILTQQGRAGYLKAWHQKDVLSQQVLKMGTEKHSTPAFGGWEGSLR